MKMSKMQLFTAYCGKVKCLAVDGDTHTRIASIVYIERHGTKQCHGTRFFGTVYKKVPCREGHERHYVSSDGHI